MEARFYAAHLASYNSGKLHGCWIDASSDVEEMQEKINAMMASSPCQGEEWAIHDHEGIKFSEFTSLSKIAEIMEIVEEYDFAHLLLNEDPYYLQNVESFKEACENFMGEYENKGDYAQDSYDMTKIPEAIQPYINWEDMVDDWEMSGDIRVIESEGKYFIFGNH
jgi:antirestriction protein